MINTMAAASRDRDAASARTRLSRRRVRTRSGRPSLSPLPPQISLPPLPLPSSMAVQDMFVKITCVECDGHLTFHCQVPGCSLPTWPSEGKSNSRFSKNRARHVRDYHPGLFPWPLKTNQNQHTFQKVEKLPGILQKKQRSSTGSVPPSAPSESAPRRRRSTGSMPTSQQQASGVGHLGRRQYRSRNDRPDPPPPARAGESPFDPDAPL